MLLELQNILKIKSASIEIGGLTVIAGENNTGKSTIGKILFSIIKAYLNSKDITISEIQESILNSLTNLNRIIDKNHSQKNNNLDINDLADTLVNNENYYPIFRNLIEEKVNSLLLTQRGHKIIQSILDTIKDNLEMRFHPEEKFHQELKRIFQSEFRESVKSFGSTEGRIRFKDDTLSETQESLSVTITEDGSFKQYTPGYIPTINDITLIESSIFLPYVSLFNSNDIDFPGYQLLGSKKRVPIHLKDMAQKLTDISTNFPNLLTPDDIRSLHAKINEVIKGEFQVDDTSRQIDFVSEEHIIPTISVASGIKSFGVIQRLLETENLSSEKILIWDEPEIHLHPHWQVLCCESIISLVKAGIPVIISSHSPYFIQGIRYFAAAEGIEDDVKYYLTETDDDKDELCTVSEVTHDINKVFSLLADPLRRIMNVSEAKTKK